MSSSVTLNSNPAIQPDPPGCSCCNYISEKILNFLHFLAWLLTCGCYNSAPPPTGGHGTIPAANVHRTSAETLGPSPTGGHGTIPAANVHRTSAETLGPSPALTSASSASSASTPVPTTPATPTIFTPLPSSPLSDADLERARAFLRPFSLVERAALRESFTSGCKALFYVLMGSKPMWWSQSGEGANEFSSMLIRGNPSLAPRFKCISDGTLYILNLPLCEQLVERHLSDFQTVLGNTASSREIMQILTDGNGRQFTRLVRHDLTLGILLGFGRENSLAFQQRGSVPTGLRGLVPFGRDDEVIGDIRLPGFAVIPDSEETRQLKAIYQEAQRRIYHTYLNRDSLEVCIALLLKHE